MAAEDYLLVFHCVLLLGSFLVWSIHQCAASELALSISWFLVCPVALAYGSTLIKFIIRERKGLPEPSVTLPGCVVGLCCVLATQFVAFVHTEHAVLWLSSIPSYSDIGIHEWGVSFTAVVSWVCYIAAVCVFELDALLYYKQSLDARFEQIEQKV